MEVKALSADDEALIAELLHGSGLGSPMARDPNPVFFKSVSDCYAVLEAVVTAGRKENRALFSKTITHIVTDSDSIQGAAAGHEEFDLVVLTRGLVDSMRNAICALLANQDTFPGIGRRAAQKDNPRETGDTVLPSCPERREYAHGAIQRALEFTFIHELAHLFYGHHTYLKKLTGARPGSALLVAPPSNPDARAHENHELEIRADRHALEIQADRYAADVTLMLGFRELRSGTALEPTPSRNMTAALERRAIQEWAIALATVFNVIEGASAVFQTHPHPRFRQLAATMSALVVWQSAVREEGSTLSADSTEFLELVNGTIDSVTEAWQIVRLPQADYGRDPLEEDQFDALLRRAMGLFPLPGSRFDGNRLV